MAATRHWGVVGGGMLGLTLAHRLAQRGQQVTVLEAAPHIGGLASAWTIDDVVWDRHYHVTLLSDTHLRGLLAELGLEGDMEWVETRTGCYSDGQLHPVSDSIEFLRFPPLALLDKLRLAATILYGAKVRDWQRLEQVRVDRWLRRWSGARTFERFWKPLLRAKLGDSYREASAAFIWATIQRLYAARRTGLKKEMFGYVPGGYARILARFHEVLVDEGVEVRLGAPAARVEADAGRVRVTERDGTRHTFDEVVVTANASVAARLLQGLPPAEAAALNAVRYQGIVCASLLLKRPLSPYYLTYITDDAPFTAVVEMSAMVDRRHFGGRSLVYLPKYCGPGDPTAQLSDEEVREEFLAGLERMHPHFRRDDVDAFRVSRVREVFAIPTLGYSQRVPPMATSLPGVHLVTSAQIVNGTLNVDETVQLAERAVPVLLQRAGSAAPPAPVAAGGAATTRAAAPPREAPPPRERPVATLSLDLDDLWSYLKTHGDSGWRQRPTFLDVVVPRALELLAARGQRATWFVVGHDAARDEHRELLAAVAAAGHELGNHSFSHEPWLHRYPDDRLDEELARTEEALGEISGQRPTGFRGPGFSLSTAVLRALHRRGYAYDASTLPTYLGPLARAFYLRGLDLSAEERAERSALFGSAREGTRPLTPYRWQGDGGGLVEVPVTTMPLLRTPIHASYLMFLAERSPALARAYLAAALRLCRWRGIPPSFLIHSHDLIGADQAPAMAFFPGMRLPSEVKAQLVAEWVDLLRRDFRVVALDELVRELATAPSVAPRFRHDDGTRIAAPARQLEGGRA